MRASSRLARRPGRGRQLRRRLASLGALAVLLAEAAGPLTPVVRAEDRSSEAEVAGEPQFPNGRVVETAPAPITTPAGGAGPSVDPTIGGEPMFVPYTPPADVAELPEERGAQSRTLANPDGTFTLEMSEGPVNFLDAEGNWQPIDLALVPNEDGGYRVAATAGSITLDTSANELGVIEIDGHRVALSSPGYASAGLGAELAGSELDANTVSFVDALETAADVWIRPVDIGLEFGATWPDATKSAVVSYVLEPDGLTPSIAKDGRSIVLTDEEGEFAGAISAPIVREGSEDGPPLIDIATVALVGLAEGGHLLSYTLDPAWLAAKERVFPVILDPVWCMGKGAAGCDARQPRRLGYHQPANRHRLVALGVQR